MAESMLEATLQYHKAQPSPRYVLSYELDFHLPKGPSDTLQHHLFSDNFTGK